MYISCVYSYGIMLFVYEVIALNVCVCLCMMPYNAPNGSSTLLLAPFRVACVGCMMPPVVGATLLCGVVIIVG